MRRLERFLRDVRGLSAVEFALISPLLILFYFSTVEIDSALTVHRRVASVAGTIADLVAQDDGVITPAELTAIYDAAGAIMAPHDRDDTIRLRVSSVRIGDGVPKVVWSSAHNWTAKGDGDRVTMPSNVIGGTSTVIMAEAEYAYDTPISDIVDGIRQRLGWDRGERQGGPIVMKQTFFMRPRRDTRICYDPPGNSPPNKC